MIQKSLKNNHFCPHITKVSLPNMKPGDLTRTSLEQNGTQSCKTALEFPYFERLISTVNKAQMALIK